MDFRLITKAFLSYGVIRVWGKALTLVFLALTLAVPAAAADRVRVLALGDSLTQGYGLIEEQGFVPQLDTWLEAQGAEVDVINGGVSGDTTAGGAARVEWSLTPDVDAMIVTLGGNDMLRGLDPAEARANLAAILDAAAARDLPVLLVGMQAPGNYGPDYKAVFDAIYPDLAEAYGVLFFENFFQGLGPGDPASLQAYFLPDGIHPNAEGVLRIVEALGPKALELVRQVQ